MFGAVENGNTYMVAILNKETFDNLQNDKLMELITWGASGYYLEWELNDDSYICIKSTY